MASAVTLVFFLCQGMCSTWLRVLKCLTAWVPGTGGADARDKVVLRLCAGEQDGPELEEESEHHFRLERIVCFGSSDPGVAGLAFSVVCEVTQQPPTTARGRTRIQHVGFLFKALTGRFFRHAT